MYYFEDQDTFEIVTRKHQYNAEALDGTIKHIPREVECLLVGHLPSKTFTYGC